MSELTMLTGTLGRPTLVQTARCMKYQRYPIHWIVAFDGLAAAISGMPALAEGPEQTTAITINPGPKDHLRLLAQIADNIKTPFVGFADDDNFFTATHTARLIERLQAGRRFVATSRMYSGDDMKIIAREEFHSDQVDTNNMAMETQLFQDFVAFLARENPTSLVQDRSLVSYLLARSIYPVRIKKYTVVYKINPKTCDLDTYRGYLVNENLFGHVLSMPNNDEKFPLDERSLDQ